MKVAAIPYFYNTRRSFGVNPAGCSNSVEKMEFKTGDFIPFFGKVVATPEVFNITTKTRDKCLVFYLNSSKDGCFRLVKNEPEKLEKLGAFYKKHLEIAKTIYDSSFSISPQTLADISRIDPSARDLIEDTTIAEVIYTTLNKPEELERLNELGYKKVNPDKEIVCIQNFAVKKKNYKDAFKLVTIPLFKGLQKNNDKNIVQKAIAYGDDPYSPVNLYLYYGFAPLSADINSIEKSRVQTPKGLRIDPNIPVVMYLPKDAVLYKYLEKMPFDVNNELGEKWFYRNND